MTIYTDDYLTHEEVQFVPSNEGRRIIDLRGEVNTLKNILDSKTKLLAQLTDECDHELGEVLSELKPGSGRKHWFRICRYCQAKVTVRTDSKKGLTSV